MATPIMDEFSVKFQIYTKVINGDKLTLAHDEVKCIFSFLKTFEGKSIVKYEDKDLDYVDLDSPIKLANRKS